MLPVRNQDRNYGYPVARRWFAYPMVSAVVLATLLSLTWPITPVLAAPGTLDPSYGQNGTVAFPTTFYQFGYLRAAIQPDGKVVVAYSRVLPYWTDAPNFALSVRRYLPNGELDTSGDWPTVDIDTMSGPGGHLGFIHPLKVIIRPDGRILVAYVRLNSTTGDTFRVALLNSNGTIQTTFTTDVTFPNFTSAADFAVLGDNRLITIIPAGELKIFDANGSLISTVPVFPATDTSHFQFQNLAVDMEGRILISAAGSGNTLLTRHNSDLTVDSSFCGGSPCSYPWTAREIEIAGDGKILTMDLTKITRHLSDGSLDAGFGLSGHFSTSDVTRSMKVDSLGRIVVALHKNDSENELWVIEADGSVSEKLNAHHLEFFGAGLFFFQEDGKLIALVSDDHPGYSQTPLAAKLVRLHYEDEGKTADLRIETIRIAPAGNVRPGDVITFDLRVGNNGKNTAGHLTFENSLPNGTTLVSFDAPEGWVTYQQPKFTFGNISCSGYSLAARQVVTFRLKLRVNTFGRVSQISNIATIRSQVSDPRISNNIAYATVTVR